MLSNFEKALEILIGLGLGDSPNAKTFKRNIEGLKKIMKNKSPFLEEK